MVVCKTSWLGTRKNPILQWWAIIIIGECTSTRTFYKLISSFKLRLIVLRVEISSSKDFFNRLRPLCRCVSMAPTFVMAASNDTCRRGFTVTKAAKSDLCIECNYLFPSCFPLFKESLQGAVSRVRTRLTMDPRYTMPTLFHDSSLYVLVDIQIQRA